MAKSYFNTDLVVPEFMNYLCKDLLPDDPLPFTGSQSRRMLEMTYTPLDSADFKRRYQMASVLKKYTFKNDVYSPDDVLQMSLLKFKENQERINHFAYEEDSSLKEVLFRARGWIDRVLQDYDLQEHLDACYFPRKASVGTPMRHSTLEWRWLHGLTGSSEHVDWFKYVVIPYLGHSSPFRGAWSEDVNLPQIRLVRELTATFVDKTFKAKRMIVPNTSIGGFYSNGLGQVIVSRLRGAGFDVARLQEVHRRLARLGSLTGNLATLDQQLASDNITVTLVKRLLPTTWASRLLYGRSNLLKLPDNSVIETETISTMGIGYTFPLQMLIFLGLSFAVRDVAVSNSVRLAHNRISAFGDDLIVPTEIVGDIFTVFGKLGLLINEDKSFWIGPFRESCGGDFFRGIDVRPFILPKGGTKLRSRDYEAWLYTCFNGLLLRWDKSQIPLVLAFIVTELQKVRKHPFIVPLYFGNDSGLKVSLEDAALFSERKIKRNIHGTLSFQYLRKYPRYVEVRYHECFLWQSLRRSSRSVGFSEGFPFGTFIPTDPSSSVDRLVHQEPGVQLFEEVRLDRQPANYRSNLNGRRLVKVATFVSISGDDGPYRSIAGSAFEW